ncbi:phospholipase C [Bryocella elongata]|uniref:Phospholipase C n=1 Tax=Bryocella elongata TaxID=863522 RepID=A0A1H5XQ44_9BACT|nr:alkaline phosphatase family protein [Bryocella elongata]SEG13605.1 phospholipase C [Bryocella elongata]
MRQLYAPLSFAVVLLLAGCGATPLPSAYVPPTTPAVVPTTAQAAIKHVVVIFGENISFDHYFGTYPNAANTGGTTFTAASGTPTNISNYVTSPTLLTANPNLNAANLVTASNSVPSNPFRLGPNQAATGDQDHNYGPEQVAFDGGKMDLFPLSVGVPDTAALVNETAAPGTAGTNALTMGYYDGNTVTAMWNYAQHFSMNDHSFGTTFGASTQGAINLISGQTNGAKVILSGAASGTIADGQGGLTLIGDEDPAYDVCSSSSATVQMTGKNIGDLMNAAGVTWGFFEGGFNLTLTNANNGAVIASGTGCLPGEAAGSRATGAVNIPGNPLKADYIPHHQPFQYYASTANPAHNRPASTAAIGTAADTGTGATQANHQYDILDFNAALAAGNLPAVSFLKAPGYQDGHAGYSDPLDEQTFVVNEINAIEASSFWANTAIIIAYDDSDGWYDHLNSILNGSQTTADAAFCNVAPTLAGVTSTAPVQGRCGYGPRLPLLVISPWAKTNYIDNTVTDQSSISRFIEDVFLGSARIGGGSYDASAGTLMNMFNFSNVAAPPSPTPLFLSPSTGAVCSPSTAACK